MSRGRARRDARGRLPALHHRRRRHRPRRRRARAQPGPPLRRGRRARLPHRGPEARRQEVRPPGRQGARARQDEQIKRLNAARFQLDIMGVPGIIVARTDAEAAKLLDGRGDERDQPFILGVTNTLGARPTRRPSSRSMRQLNARGRRRDQRPPALRDLATRSTPTPTPGSSAAGVAADDRRGRRAPTRTASAHGRRRPSTPSADAFLDAWQAEAGLKTLGRGRRRR